MVRDADELPGPQLREPSTPVLVALFARRPLGNRVVPVIRPDVVAVAVRPVSVTTQLVSGCMLLWAGTPVTGE